MWTIGEVWDRGRFVKSCEETLPDTLIQELAMTDLVGRTASRSRGVQRHRPCHRQRRAARRGGGASQQL